MAEKIELQNTEQPNKPNESEASRGSSQVSPNATGNGSLFDRMDNHTDGRPSTTTANGKPVNGNGATNAEKVAALKSTNGITLGRALGWLVPIVLVVLAIGLWAVNKAAAIVIGMIAAAVILLVLLVRWYAKRKANKKAANQTKQSQQRPNSRQRAQRPGLRQRVANARNARRNAGPVGNAGGRNGSRWNPRNWRQNRNGTGQPRGSSRQPGNGRQPAGSRPRPWSRDARQARQAARQQRRADRQANGRTPRNGRQPANGPNNQRGRRGSNPNGGGRNGGRGSRGANGTSGNGGRNNGRKWYNPRTWRDSNNGGKGGKPSSNRPNGGRRWYNPRRWFGNGGSGQTPGTPNPNGGRRRRLFSTGPVGWGNNPQWNVPPQRPNTQRPPRNYRRWWFPGSNRHDVPNSQANTVNPTAYAAGTNQQGNSGGPNALGSGIDPTSGHYSWYNPNASYTDRGYDESPTQRHTATRTDRTYGELPASSQQFYGNGASNMSNGNVHQTVRGRPAAITHDTGAMAGRRSAVLHFIVYNIFRQRERDFLNSGDPTLIAAAEQYGRMANQAALVAENRLQIAAIESAAANAQANAQG